MRICPKSVAPRAHLGYNLVTMKKFVSLLTVVIVAAVLAVALAACNNATTQGQLVDAWKNARPYQRYTYSVTDSAFEGSEGEYVSVITYHKAYNADENSPAYNPDRVIIGGRTIEQREGYLISNTLHIKLGRFEYHYVTECYFILTDGSNYLLPYATHRSEKVNGDVVFSMDGTYNGSSLAYTITANGESKSGNIGLNSPYYDNNEFHQSLRGISTFGTSFSFSFNTAVVSASEQTSISLTLSVNGTETVSDLPFPSVSKDGDGNEVQNQTTALNCYHTTLSRSTTVTGAAQTLYYTVDPVYAAINEEGTDTLISTSYDDSKWQLPHVLVRIVEPYNDADRNPQKVTYTLKEISLIP